MKNDAEAHNKNLRVECLTPDIFKEFYKMDKTPITVRGYAFYLQDKLVAVGGVRYTVNHFILFSDINEEARGSAATVLRCSKKVMELVDKMKIETIAIAEEVTSPRLLKHLGFTFYDLVDDMMVYKRGRKENG